jgi:hypothetical protein
LTLGTATVRSVRPGPATLIAVLIATGVGVLTIAPAAAADEHRDAEFIADLVAGTIDGEGALALAARHRPLIVVKDQTEPCDTDGEAWLPTRIDIVLDNPEVLLRQVGRGDPVVMRGPTSNDLYRGSSGLFLDFPGLALEPGCTFERDFERFAQDVEPTVYARVAQQAQHPDRIVLQYWFYWYFNRWNNLHESDWEGIQLLFDAATVAEALEAEPVAVAYAQHEGGELSAWNDIKLERVGPRPVVYSSAGSHASYFSPAVFLGRRGTEGFGCDVTTGPSTEVDPALVLLPATIDGPDDPAAWLTFAGRWGELNPGANNGPTGPAFKDRWVAPVDWHDAARRNSVVVPGGDGPTAALVEVFCDVTAVGSAWLARIQLDPSGLLVPLAIIVALGWLLARRTVWTSLESLPVVARRRAGQILRGAVGLGRRLWPGFGVIGAIYLPAAVVLGGLVALADLIPGVRTLLDVGAGTAGISALLAVLIGGLSTTFAFNVVIAVMTRFLLEEPSGGWRRLLGAAWDATVIVLRRWQALFGALLLAAAIIGALLISVIGIPFALWLIIRYQFIAEVVTTEDHSTRGALRRSAQLVRGRWFSTAATVGFINLTVVVISTTVSLVILIGATGLPLWVFPAVSMLVTAFVAPVAAAAHVLLFGDRRAALDQTGPVATVVASQ